MKKLFLLLMAVFILFSTCSKDVTNYYEKREPIPIVFLSIVITTNPEGLIFKVDNTLVTGRQIFNWAVGDTHTIGTISPQSGGIGIEYLFSNWSDGGLINHDIVITDTSEKYTVNFIKQVNITLATNPSGLFYIVDGSMYANIKYFNWIVGDTHTIGTISPQVNGNFTSTFIDWNDGGLINHDIVVPTEPENYIANFHCESIIIGDNICLSFDGIDDYVIADNFNNQLILNELTIEFLINPNRDGHILSKRHSNDIDFHLEITSDNYLYIHLGSNIGAFKTDTPISINEWQYIAIVYIGTEKKIQVFKNGILTSNIFINENSIINTFSNDLLIGHGDGYPKYYDGKIDEIRISNTIRDIPVTISPYFEPDMNTVILYHINQDDSPNMINDFSANETDGILHGAGYSIY